MFEKVVTKILRALCFIMFMVMIVVVFAQVMLRYFFHAPIAWSDELSRLMLVWVSFLGVTLVHFSKAGHPAVRALVQRFSSKTQKMIDIFINLILVIGFVVIFKASLQYTLANTRLVSAVLHYPNALKYAVVPLSMFLMAIKSIFNLRDDIKTLSSYNSKDGK